MSNILPMFQPEIDMDAEKVSAAWLAVKKCYPRKEKMAIAEAKFTAIVTTGLKTQTLDKDSNSYVSIFLKATPDEIVEAVKKYEKSMRKPGIGNYGYVDDGKYIPMLSTWLNQGRWMDVV